ncbi:MAG: NAD(P)-dependent oxidoreductase [Gemmataceae bacterium]
MTTRRAMPLLLLISSFILHPSSFATAAPPKMKFNEVREIAPGVFFRYSSISPTDMSIFGGSNHLWVVFEDYVVVIDANFPKEARDVVADIKKTTTKPIRYVLDTHHHGDHAWGNAVWIDQGATIISHRNCAKILRQTGPAEFAAAGKGKAGRKDVAESTLKFPTLIFDDKLVLDDGKQRVEFYQLGHSHTIGDAVAYLPKHKILCTGDACVNGAFNYMGQSDSASWVRALERMQEFDVAIVAPGHGQLDDRSLLQRQKRYFQDLRRLVKKGIDDGKEIDDIVKGFELPWYKEWTTVQPASDNVKHVWNEYMGLVSPWDFEYDYGILAGPSPTKDTPGWTKPKKIVVHPELMAMLKRVAPEVEFLPARTTEEAVKLARDADAVIGFAAPEFVTGSKARWVHVRREEQEKLGAVPADRKLTITDSRRADGPHVADHTFALLLQLTRGVMGKKAMPPVELRGKTMLVIGSGDTADQVAKRAGGFGMKVVRKADGFQGSLGTADVVVLAVPLSEKTRGIIGAKQLAAMKKGAMLVNAVHAGLIDADALKAEAGRIHVATDGVVGTLAGPDAVERRIRLTRENVRRFAAGEPLLGVVE